MPASEHFIKSHLCIVYIFIYVSRVCTVSRPLLMCDLPGANSLLLFFQKVQCVEVVDKVYVELVHRFFFLSFFEFILYLFLFV